MTENFDDLFDEIPPPETPVAVATDETTVAVEVSRDGILQSSTVHQAAQIPNNGRPPSKHQFLYLDLETCPDHDRISQFDIPALPPMATEMLSPAEFCSQGLSEIKQWFENHGGPDVWLSHLEIHEKSQKKPRVGLFEAIEKSRNALAAQRKLLSVTPEYCRIVAAAWAMGSGKVHSTVFDQHAEAAYLETLWREIANVRSIVGYNILHFDLPVILTRSALLGVTPSRRINLSPYRNTDVCDLMVARYPKGGQKAMKPLVESLGIAVDRGDCKGIDGSHVENLYANDQEKLKRYVSYDVEDTRNLHQFWSGFFVD